MSKKKIWLHCVCLIISCLGIYFYTDAMEIEFRYASEISQELLPSEVIKLIFWILINDTTSGIDKNISKIRSINKHYNSWICDVLLDRYRFCDGVCSLYDNNSQFVKNNLKFLLEQCQEFIINRLIGDYPHEDDKKAYKEICYKKSNLPYPNIQFYDKEKNKQYAQFIKSCCHYLWFKSLSRFTTFHGYKMHDLRTEFPKYVKFIYKLFGFKPEIKKSTNRVDAYIMYLPLIDPSQKFRLNKNCPLEVIVRITSIDDLLPDDWDGDEEQFFVNAWQEFWQNVHEDLQSHKVRHFSLSFWDVLPSEEQLAYSIIGMPEKLKNICIRLDLTRCYLGYLPDSIGDLYNLKWLDCWDNKLKEIPKCIEKLSKLERVEFSENNIKEIKKDDIPFLPNLLTFSCTSNPYLSNVIIDFSKVPLLRSLSLSGNYMKKFKCIFSKKNSNYVCELDLSKNNLEKFPGCIDRMEYLESVNFKNCFKKGEVIPTSVLELPKLSELWLPKNIVVEKWQKNTYQALIDRGVFKNPKVIENENKQDIFIFNM